MDARAFIMGKQASLIRLESQIKSWKKRIFRCVNTLSSVVVPRVAVTNKFWMLFSP